MENVLVRVLSRYYGIKGGFIRFISNANGLNMRVLPFTLILLCVTLIKSIPQ